MRTRIITAVLGIPLVVLVLVVGNPWLRLAMLLVSCIALYEMYSVMKSAHHPIKWLGYLTLIVYFLMFEIVKEYYMAYLSVVVVIALMVMIIKHKKYNLVDIALTIFSTLYTSLLFSFIVLIRDVELGKFWVWLVPISAWGSDTFAYFTGLTIGKHKLAPQLSPKKTIEGSIGGVIGAGVLGYVYSTIYGNWVGISLDNLLIVIIVIAVMLGAILSQFGDLAASAIKRQYNQKDFGNILPGHGGILDRFDSFLFVAPAIYISVVIMQGIMR